MRSFISDFQLSILPTNDLTHPSSARIISISLTICAPTSVKLFPIKLGTWLLFTSLLFRFRQLNPRDSNGAWIDNKAILSMEFSGSCLGYNSQVVFFFSLYPYGFSLWWLLLVTLLIIDLLNCCFFLLILLWFSIRLWLNS